MPAFLIPILVSAGLGLLGGVAKGIGQNALVAQNRERIRDIENTDAVTAAANNAMRGLGSNAAQRGMFGSGQHAVSVGRAVGDIAAQREAQEQALIQQILQAQGPDMGTFGNIAVPALGGLAGGAASGAGSILGSETGMSAVLNWLNGAGTNGNAAPMSFAANPNSTLMGTQPGGTAPVTIPVGTQSVNPGVEFTGQQARTAARVASPVGTPSAMALPGTASQFGPESFFNAFGLSGQAPDQLFQGVNGGNEPSQNQLIQMMAMLMNKNTARG